MFLRICHCRTRAVRAKACSLASHALHARLLRLVSRPHAHLPPCRPASTSTPTPPPHVTSLLARIQSLEGETSLSVDERAFSRDVDVMLSNAITCGATQAAVQVLSQLQVVEERLSLRITTPTHLVRLLNACAFSGDVTSADEVVSLALKRPETLLEPGLIDSYAGMCASVSSPDLVRGLTFAAFMLEFNHDAFLPYFKSLTRTHGPAALGDAVDVILDTCAAGSSSQGGSSPQGGEWSFNALLHAQRALAALPSEHALKLLRPLMAVSEASPPRVAAAIEGHVEALVRLGWVMDAAHAVLAADAGLELHHALFRVCKTLTHRVQTLASEVPRGAGGGVVATTGPLAEALDVMLRVFERAVAARSAMPGLIERVFARLIEHDRLGDVERITSYMLGDRDLRAMLRSDKHCNAVIDALLKADRGPAAEMIFRRMLAADAVRYPHLTPNVKSFNMFILRAARKGDKAEVRRLMTMMSDRGISADAFTVSAISVLRSPGTVASVAAPSAEARAVEEADADALLARIADSNGRLARSSTVAHATQGTAPAAMLAGGTTGPFNQLIQTYFRLAAPAKALGVLDVMHTLHVVPGADTLRTLLVGLSLTGGQRMHGVPSDRLPVGWGGVKPDDVYARERASNSEQRRRVGEAGDSDSGNPSLRFAHAATCLARLRATPVPDPAAQPVETALRALLSAWQPVPVSAHGTREPVGAAADDVSLPSEGSIDLLPHLPLLLARLRAMGMSRQQIREAADPVTSWACDLLAPARALHLFVSMHSAGMWDESLTRMQRSTAMFPGLVAFDVRGAQVPSACAFLHVLLHAAHSQWHVSRDAAPLLAQDWALLAGSSSSALCRALLSALQIDAQPPLMCKTTSKALLINKHDLRAWVVEAAGGTDAR